jgi:hypothetical protein
MAFRLKRKKERFMIGFASFKIVEHFNYKENRYFCEVF